MLSASEFWKSDLLKLSKKVLRRIIQRRWTNRSIYALEKELFYGFFAIRKLIEVHRVSEDIVNSKIFIREIPLKNAPSILEENPDLSAIEVGKVKQIELSIKQICNQFIHSERIYPLIPDAHFIGVLVCSDHKRKTGMYFITVFDISEIYKKSEVIIKFNSKILAIMNAPNRPLHLTNANCRGFAAPVCICR